MKTRNKALIISLIFALIFTMCPMSAFAKTKYKKSAVYSQVYKKGNNVYCVCRVGIYKVNNKTNKVTRLVKNPEPDFLSLENMIYSKGHVYYYDETSAIGGSIRRVNVESKKKKTIVSWATGNYSVNGSKIYYEEYYIKKNGDIGDRSKTCNLDGKKKKKSSYIPKMSRKKTNVEGYKIIEESNIVSKESSEYDEEYDEYEYEVEEVTKYYLIKPDGSKIKLGEYTVLK